MPTPNAEPQGTQEKIHQPDGTPTATVPEVAPRNGAAADQEARDVALAAMEKAEKEGATPAPEPDKPAEPPADPKYAALAGNYAKLEKELRTFKKSVLPELQQKAEAHDALIARLKDPAQRYDAFEEHGGDYREYTDRVVNSDKEQLTPEQKQIAALTARLDAQDTVINEGRAAKEKAVADEQSRQLQANALKIVTDGGDTYALTATLKQSGALITKYREMIDAGTPPENDAAVAAAVEADLSARLVNDMKSLSAVPAFTTLIKELGYTWTDPAKTNTPPAKDPTSEPNQPNRVAAPATTLTNGLSAESGGGVDYSKMSSQQKQMRAREIATKVDQANKERLGQV